MRKSFKKNFVFFPIIILSVFFLLSSSLIFAQRELEVEYPEIGEFRPETVATPLPEYIKYIFNFVIAVIGLIGFAALIVGGVRYLTSAGSPEKIKNAKKQIKYAFLGILILLFSYLILTTINPQLIIFRPLGITPVAPAPSPPGGPISEVPSSDLLGRIKELAEAVKRKAGEMRDASRTLTNLINNCDCRTTQPLCLCKTYVNCGDCYSACGGCVIDNVNPCYSARTTQPCPDDREIKKYQLIIFALRDDMLYYKNRALAEREDLKEDIEKVLNKKIEWYTNKIAVETNVLNQLPEGAEKELQREIVETLREQKTKLETEKNYKERLKEKLLELANAIEEVIEPGKKISELPDECLSNVPKKCRGTCRGYCHNTPPTGCVPVSCSGGNPCPTQEIQRQSDSIADSYSNIARIADEIIAIVSQLREGEAVAEACQTPEQLAQQNNVPYPRRRAASLETLLNCVAGQTGQSLPAEGGSNQFYGSLYTYEHQNELCNYTRGSEICGDCAHMLYSCHYGGAAGSNGALAIDFGNERNGSTIIQAALSCGAKSARCENEFGQTIDCASTLAHHIHITEQNCDRN